MFIRPFVLWLESLIKQRESRLRPSLSHPLIHRQEQSGLKAKKTQFTFCVLVPCSASTTNTKTNSTDIHRHFYAVKHL